jgi:hypothetical protein
MAANLTIFPHGRQLNCFPSPQEYKMADNLTVFPRKVQEYKMAAQ